MATVEPKHRILMIICIIFHSRSVLCKNIYIKASNNLSTDGYYCPDSSCLTLTQFTLNATYHTNDANDIALIFDGGSHSLESELQITQKVSFSMVGNTSSFSNGSGSVHVVIACNPGHGRFKINGVHNVYMNGLTFVGCLGNKIESVEQFTAEDSKFVGEKYKRSVTVNREGSLIMIFQCTLVNFRQTSFEQNEYGKVRDVLYKKYRPLLNSYVTVIEPVSSGGAIYAERSNIHVVECLFENHRVQNGGGIYINDNSKLTVTNSSFLNNYGGSAIYANDTALLIANSTFVRNGGHDGGAVRWTTYDDDGTVTITGSHFSCNVALSNGGALFWVSTNTAHVTIASCNFVNNTVLKGSGGVLQLTNTNSNAVIIISNNFFSNNTVTASDSAHGGVISVDSSNQATVNMNYNYFVNNYASQKGGVLSFLKGSSLQKATDIILNYNQFVDNLAYEDGGVFELKNANVKVTGSDFTNNRANGNGGIFFIEGSNITLMQSSFKSNTAGKDGGVAASEQSSVSISECDFINNSVEEDGHAGVITAEHTSISLINTSLINNKAAFGGVLWAQQAAIEIYDVIVLGNLANTDGGVLHTERSQILIVRATFIGNGADNNGGIMQADRDWIMIIDCEYNQSIAGNDGGVIRAYLSEVFVSNSTFTNSRAGNDGGVQYIEQSNLTISNQTHFMGNNAETGGVIWSDAGILKIDETSFTNNMASTGGVIWTDAGTAKIGTTYFTGNKAITGAVMWIDRAIIRGHSVKILNNYASYATIYSLESTIEFINSLLSSNIGSLCAIESTVQLRDVVMTKMQVAGNDSSVNQLDEGGAITAFQSDVTFYGTSHIMHHRASQGGAIRATEAKLSVQGSLTIANNTAWLDGGGIYLYQSELTCQRQSAIKIVRNTAMKNGGGIYASGSLIKVKIPIAMLQKHATLSFEINKASNGGGMYLAMDSKVVILKSIASNLTNKCKTISFTANEADYGGAVYVSDDGMCAFSAFDNKECAFQVLALYGSGLLEHNNDRCINIYFENNVAKLFGKSLYGGLMDRCKVSPLSELLHDNITLEEHMQLNNATTVRGLAYFRSFSNIEYSDIDSLPVRICFCRDGQPDCSYNPGPLPIRRDQLTEISLSLAALDQINHPIEATIYNKLSSGGNLCQHHIQTNDANCSVINFTASLNLNESQSEELVLLPSGPCKEIPNSQVRVTFNVYCPKCPVGFELVEDEEGCRCHCDERLLPFISNCQLSSNALVRDKNIWIAYLNTTVTDDSEGYQYLIHPYCPLDYCHPSSARVEINLNLPNGHDAQCANGRTGLLCGTCQSGLSLSLGSSHCIRCPSHWSVYVVSITLASLLAGILLVAFVLLLNLTVAVGTLNAIIFYANILAARHSLFLKFSTSSFATVFISWLNLEIGFNGCFFKGMDAFSKTALELAFPVYIISLVILIIVAGEYSNKFSSLIGKRNPVATLATLVLLSYTKLLNTVITSLSFTVLHYPDGSHRTVWLADASVDYLRGKHVALFILACIILIAGVFYTALLLFWQCFLRHQECFLLRWTKYPKLCHFVEPYHAPYTFRHRYWTGLLLLSRVLLHLVSAINTTGNPRLIIVTVSLIIACLLLIKGVIANKVYKNRLIDISETIVHFNLLALSALTWYSLDADNNQTAAAYISVMIIFALLLAVIAVHVYQYTNLFTTTKNIQSIKHIMAAIQVANSAKQRAEKDDHSKPKVSVSKSTKNPEWPTYSVVEIHNPQVYSSD